MTKRDYEKLAAWLKSSAETIGLVDWQLEILAQRLCWQVLIPDSTRFNPHKFMHAVTGKGMPVREEDKS